MHTNLFLEAIFGLMLTVFFACAWIAGRPRGRQLLTLANDGPISVGEHEGAKLTGYIQNINSATGYTYNQRFLLVKQTRDGTDNHYSLITSVLDQPVGVLYDDPAATTDIVNIRGLGGAGSTRRMIAAGAITAGDIVVSNGDGTVKTSVGLASGVYWAVGVAVTTTSALGDLVEVQPFLSQFGVNLLT